MTSSTENEEEKPAPIIFGDESFCDVILVVENQDFKANKMILANHSDVFKIMFFGNFKESKEDRVEINDVPVDNFRRFLEIIYTGKVSDPSKFLEFRFLNNKHLAVEIKPEEAEPREGVSHYYTCSYKKLFHDFWKDTTEILNIADRFNTTSIIKNYLGFVTAAALYRCRKENCSICFNTLMFALVSGNDVSECEKQYPISFYKEWVFYANEEPFPDIHKKAMENLFHYHIS